MGSYPQLGRNKEVVNHYSTTVSQSMKKPRGKFFSPCDSLDCLDQTRWFKKQSNGQFKGPIYIFLSMHQLNGQDYVANTNWRQGQTEEKILGHVLSFHVKHMFHFVACLSSLMLIFIRKFFDVNYACVYFFKFQLFLNLFLEFVELIPH